MDLILIGKLIIVGGSFWLKILKYAHKVLSSIPGTCSPSQWCLVFVFLLVHSCILVSFSGCKVIKDSSYFQKMTHYYMQILSTEATHWVRSRALRPIRAIQGRIQDFGKGGSNHGELWNESAKPARRRWRRCWGRVWGVKTPSLRGVWGGLPIKLSIFWCFLLQSRHSSTLLPGLLIQAY